MIGVRKIKKDFYILFTEQGKNFEIWKTMYNYLPKQISLIILLIGVYMIVFGQDTPIIADIGIGLLSSSIVTSVYLFNDYLRSKIANRNNRTLFFEDFILFLFDSLKSLPLLNEKNVDYNMKEYIVHQHRRFHDNYKKIIVHNHNESEIAELKKLVKEIINNNKVRIDSIFNSMTYRVELGPFAKQELDLLRSYYSEFQAMVNTINDENDAVIYHTAMWLTSNRRLLEDFSELKDFDTISVNFDKDGNCKFDYSEYINKEPFFKFRLEFQEIRRRNYEEFYSDGKEKDT